MVSMRWRLPSASRGLFDQRRVATIVVLLSVVVGVPGAWIAPWNPALSSTMMIACMFIGVMALYVVLAVCRPWPLGPFTAIAVGFSLWMASDVLVLLAPGDWHDLLTIGLYVGGYLPAVWGVIMLVHLVCEPSLLLRVSQGVAFYVPLAGVVFAGAVLPVSVGQTLTVAAVLDLIFPLLGLVVTALLVASMGMALSYSVTFACLAVSFLLGVLSDFLWATAVHTPLTPAEESLATTGYVLSYSLMLTALVCSTVVNRKPMRAGQPMSDSGTGLAVIGACIIAALMFTVLWPGLSTVGRNIVVTSCAIGLLAVSGSVAQLVHAGRQESVKFADEAMQDVLTRLPNRRARDTITTEVTRLLRQGNPERYVALIDLDNFKAFNDSFGHARGDALLEEAARRWSRALPEGSFLARLGGEEFTVLLPPRITSLHAAVLALDGCHGILPEGQTCSMGLAVWTADLTAHDAVKRADQAMYQAKRHGKNRTMVWQTDADTQPHHPVDAQI